MIFWQHKCCQTLHNVTLLCVLLFFLSLSLNHVKVVLAIVLYLWCWNKISQLVGFTQVNNNDYYKKCDREYRAFFIIQVYVCCESTNSVLYWIAKSAWALSKRKSPWVFFLLFWQLVEQSKKQFTTGTTYISHDLLFESWLVHYF